MRRLDMKHYQFACNQYYFITGYKSDSLIQLEHFLEWAVYSYFKNERIGELSSILKTKMYNNI